MILTLEGWSIFLSMTYVNLEALEALYLSMSRSMEALYLRFVE